MRVFITGATGFIGQALVTRLSREGHEVVAWVRNLERAAEQLSDALTLVHTEASDEALRDALSACDAVVNLAGTPVVGRWTESYRKALVTSRVDLTQRLTAAMHARPVDVLISSSAVGYYGDRGEERLSESSAPAEGFLARLCIDWEEAARQGAPSTCRVVLLRTGIVLGRGGGALDKMLLPFKAGLGGTLGSGRQIMPWSHIDDMVQIIVSALDDARYEGVFNASAPTPVSNRVFTKALGRTLSRPTLFPVPVFGLKTLYGEAASVLIASQNAHPDALRALGFDFEYADIESALSAIFS